MGSTPATKPILIGLILATVALGLFSQFWYLLFDFSVGMMDVVLILNTIYSFFYLGLVVVFAIYLFQKDYRFPFVTLLLIYIPIYYQELKALLGTGGYGAPGSTGLVFDWGLMFLLILLHAGSIIFTPARQNKWLLFYAIATAVISIAAGNLVKLQMFELAILMAVLVQLIPLLFIFLIRDEFGSIQPKAQTDLLDDEFESTV